MAYSNIKDPSAHFQTVLYTGTGNANNAITNDGNSNMQPDFIWFKSRDAGHSHYVVDSSRGRDKGLYPDGVNSEVTSSGSTTDCQSFDTDGFTVGTPEDANSTNSSSSTKVAWQWKANGGTTSSNTSGTITTTVQANTDAGFSIVTWAGNASNATMGHGLGATPKVIISKALGTTNDWNVYHRDVDATAPYNYLLNLHTTGARSAATGSWGTSLSHINSTTFYKKYWINYNTNMIAYAFAEKQGFSKFGKYVGNGSGTSDGTFDGTFVYTGFSPSFLMIKRSDGGAEDWNMFDNKRQTYNYNQKKLYANQSAAESGNVYDAVDFLSNGFKIRTGRGGTNTSGGTYMYMAFAENPFVAGGIPTTAR